MPRLLGLGLLAAALFSVTFILNRAMSLSGGHWVWSATLRYVDMAALLTLWIGSRYGVGRLTAILRLLRRQLWFWLLSGGVGFGVFYACICYAADRAPGWIVAASWQLTILATPIIMSAFGTRVPLRGTAFCGVIALGILVLNVQRIGEGVTVAQMATGILPVLVAAFATAPQTPISSTSTRCQVGAVDMSLNGAIHPASFNRAVSNNQSSAISTPKRHSG